MDDLAVLHLTPKVFACRHVMEKCCGEEERQASLSSILTTLTSTLHSSFLTLLSWAGAATAEWDSVEVLLATLLAAHLTIIVLFVFSRGTAAAFLA